jgi:signal transduction histidine kinase
VEHLAGACRLVFLILIISAALTMFAGSFGPGGTTPWWIAVLVLGQATAALAALHSWRRSIPLLMAHPAVLFAAATVAGLVLPRCGAPVPMSFVLFAICLLAGLLYDWRGRLLFPAICALGWLVLGFRPGIDEVSSSAALYGTPVIILLAAASGVLQRRLLDRQAMTERALREATRTAAAAEERSRIARDMHDSTIKMMYGIALRADGLTLWAKRDPSRIPTEARLLAAETRTAAAQVRELVGELRTPADPTPLPAQIDRACRAWSAETGIPVAVTCDAACTAEPPTTHELRMVLGEALENVRRHAEASRVEVRLLRKARAIILEVIDDGCGITSAPATSADAFGILGMRERGRRLGGSLTLERMGPAGGTWLRICVPAPDAPGHPGDTAALAGVGGPSKSPSKEHA